MVSQHPGVVARAPSLTKQAVRLRHRARLKLGRWISLDPESCTRVDQAEFWKSHVFESARCRLDSDNNVGWCQVVPSRRDRTTATVFEERHQDRLEFSGSERDVDCVFEEVRQAATRRHDHVPGLNSVLQKLKLVYGCVIVPVKRRGQSTNRESSPSAMNERQSPVCHGARIDT
jgi:hypothetical protein